MRLSPREIEKLMLHNVGFLAQKRLARGVRLNLPEAVGLIASQILEFIREGRPVAELMNLGRQLLGRRQVQTGVPELLHEVQVEGTFPDGTKLVTVHSPVTSENGDLKLALYGSFLPVPDLSCFAVDNSTENVTAGEILAAEGDLVLNEGRDCVELPVTNLGDRPVQVGSHYHFVETNSSLQFDRGTAYGKRLDIPAGTAIRFEPGDTKTVTLVSIDGNQVIRGGNNLADGKVSAEGKQAALENVQSQNFATT